MLRRPLRSALLVWPLLAGLCLTGGGRLAADPAAAGRPGLALVPLAGTPVTLSAEEWDKLPRQTLAVEFPAGHAHQAGKAEVSGIPLRALLTRIGVPEGRELHGPWLRRVVVVEAADGYRVVFALPELDPGYTADPVLLVDRRDGKPVAAEEGPLRLVVPADRHPARWMRQVVRITVRDVP